MAEHGSEGPITGTGTTEELVQALERPRMIMTMVKAGPAVDAVIEELAPLLDEGDTIVDGGNWLFRDTQRRDKALDERGLRFLGVGVSGGEEGALKGPSIMPGGERRPTTTPSTSSRRSPRRSTARRAAPTSAPTARATT